ncbi:MAG: LUD domain-containing protein [Aigarchaeota archaeon]|nr:LUD domain-containing protein [Candidatus Pelearchaeum maunauluense]
MAGRELAREVEAALRNTRQAATLMASLSRMRDKRRERMREIPLEELEKLKEMRRRNLKNLSDNLKLLKDRIESLGGKLYIAKDHAAACKYVADVIARNNAKIVVKSKSLTSEEIRLNEWLERLGVEVVETDLGERIVQLAGERPSHLLAPAVHKDAASVAEIFAAGLKPEAEAITQHVRSELRSKFLGADVGITGANVIAAEEGAIFVVTNEGNERFVTSIPRVYICIAGVEKVVSNLADALHTLSILIPSATGQRVSSYITVIGLGPENAGRWDEFHIVLIDNSRFAALGDKTLSEALECIRCAACFNVCPTYRIVGGHVFGHIYTGPIGLPWTAITHGEAAAYSFSSLCVGCGLCKLECPVEIDIPFLISSIKERGNGLYGEAAPWLLRNYDTLIKLGSHIPRVANLFMQSRLGRKILERLAGIDRRRQLPRIASKSFRKLVREESKEEAEKRAALFTDAMIMYMFPEIGVDAVDILKRFGVGLVVPRQLSSGMPLIQYGYLKQAREIARKNVSYLLEHVRAGCDVVCLEPTAAYCIKEVYPRLIDDESAGELAAHTYGFPEYLASLLRDAGISLDKGMRVAYHWPCHARERGAQPAMAKLLSMLGIEVSFVDEGCCGMAGTWGMRRGYIGYELSRSIGEKVVQSLEATEADTIITESTICMLQFRELSRLRVIHAIPFLKSVLEGG